MINPNNIHCMALNYKGVSKSNEIPLYFVKTLNCLAENGCSINYPKHSERFWTEVELTIVIGEECSNISYEHALDYVEGFVVGADLTCQNIHSRDHHLGFSKSRDNFCPISTDLVQLNKTDNLEMTTEINGVVTQRGNTKDMLYNVERTIEYLSSFITLKKHDIILTGTPSGVENNTLSKGDHVKHVIENVGELNYQIK